MRIVGLLMMALGLLIGLAALVTVFVLIEEREHEYLPIVGCLSSAWLGFFVGGAILAASGGKPQQVIVQASAPPAR